MQLFWNFSTISFLLSTVTNYFKRMSGSVSSIIPTGGFKIQVFCRPPYLVLFDKLDNKSFLERSYSTAYHSRTMLCNTWTCYFIAYFKRNTLPHLKKLFSGITLKKSSTTHKHCDLTAYHSRTMFYHTLTLLLITYHNRTMLCHTRTLFLYSISFQDNAFNPLTLLLIRITQQNNALWHINLVTLHAS